ncbi:hypothetical protein DFH09DRAFT_1209907 [Mycena vulgaris]|nr:hypothetical protein DFH09DRAFT_1209907 [Mycena vulgaris]
MNTYLDAGLESSDLPDALEEGECAAFEECGDGCAVGEGVAEAGFAEVRDSELKTARRGILGHHLGRVDVRVGEDAGFHSLEIRVLGVGDDGDQDACQAHRRGVVDGARRNGKDEGDEQDLACGARSWGSRGEDGKGRFAEAGHFGVLACSYNRGLYTPGSGTAVPLGMSGKVVGKERRCLGSITGLF